VEEHGPRQRVARLAFVEPGIRAAAQRRVRERTRSGLRHAREQGRRSGRKPKLSKAQMWEVIEAVTSGRKSAAEAARLFDIHPSTVSRIMESAK